MGIAVTVSGVRAEARKKNATILDDVAVLRRKWHAALLPTAQLPPFEEIMLGSLGRLADNIGLIRSEAGIPTLLRAGRYIQNWLGHEVCNARSATFHRNARWPWRMRPPTRFALRSLI